MKILGGIIAVVLFIVLLFALEVGGLHWDGFMSKQKANIERNVFEETKSFNEGKEQELLRYYQQYYAEDDPTAKDAILFTVSHAFADYDDDRLDEELQDFLKTAKYRKGN